MKMHFDKLDFICSFEFIMKIIMEKLNFAVAILDFCRPLSFLKRKDDMMDIHVKLGACMTK